MLDLPLLLFTVAAARSQAQRRVFPRIMTGDPYTLECYLPQITNGPNFPTWSPDGKALAFSMKGSIWRQKLGQTAARELTTDQGYAGMPAWSPDGNFIVYTSDWNEQIHLHLLDLRTCENRALTTGNSIDVAPDGSPDESDVPYG